MQMIKMTTSKNYFIGKKVQLMAVSWEKKNDGSDMIIPGLTNMGHRREDTWGLLWDVSQCLWLTRDPTV